MVPCVPDVFHDTVTNHVPNGQYQSISLIMVSMCMLLIHRNVLRVVYVSRSAPIMPLGGRGNNMNRRGMLKTFVAALAGSALPAIAREKYRLRILSYRCVGCRDCYRVCPKAEAIVIRRGKAVINEDECNHCMRCETVCSYGAIERCEKYER